MNQQRVAGPLGSQPHHEPIKAEVSSDGPQHFLLSPVAVICLAAAAWIVSLSLSSKLNGGGILSWPVVSHARWDTTCPDCGTIEGIAQLREPHGPGRIWRIDVRMAGGQLRHLRSAAPLAPGERVTVKGEQLFPSGEAAVCR